MTRVIRILTVAFALAAAFLSCSTDDPVKERHAAVKSLYRGGKAKIAVANSFEDNQTKMWEGALLAQERVNALKIAPVDIELVKSDDGGTQISGTRNAYQIALDNEICAVIGHGYSDISLPCSLIYQYYGILTFNFISTIHSLTERNNPLIFSNMPSDTDFGDEIAYICENNDYKKILIFYLDNTSGTSLSNAFELSCNNRGIEVVSRESYDLTSSEQFFDRSIKHWKNNFVFDAVFIAGRMPSLLNIITMLRNNGITCPIVGADPFDDPLLTKALPPSENDKIFAVSNYNPASNNVRFREFYNSFREKYGDEPDQEALQAYDAVFVLARAMAKAKSAVPSDLASVLRSGYWNEAAGPYSFQTNGAIKDRTLTPKVFRDGSFVEFSY